MAEKMQPSPEAQDYKAHLKTSVEETGALPPVAERQAVKKFIRGTAERRNTEATPAKPEAPKPVESAEAKAGKERLAELIERGDVSRNIIDRVAVCLDLESWQALQKFENDPGLFPRIIDTSRRQRKDFDKEISEIAQKSTYAEPLKASETAAALFAKILNENNAALELASAVDRPNRDKFNTARGDRVTVDYREHLPLKVQFDRTNLPTVLNAEYYTIVRLVAMELPEKSDFSNASEADQMITAYVEAIGRNLGKNVRLIDGAFYIDGKSPLAERLAGHEKREAEQLVAAFRKSREIKREMEREFKQKMGEILMRLSEINNQLNKNLPVLRRDESVFHRIIRSFSSSQDDLYKKEGERVQFLQKERDELYGTLSDINSQGRSSHDLREKYESYYIHAPRFAGSYSSLVAANKDYAAKVRGFWDSLAEETAVRLVDEDIARGKLEELKSK